MKRRLVLAIAAVAGGAVLLFALPLAVVLERSYRDEELLRLQRDTNAATRGIDLSHGRQDQIELPRFTGEIGIYSLTGSRIAGAGPRVADQPTRSALRDRQPIGTAPDGQLVVAVPLLSGEAITGAVRGQRSQRAVARRAHRAWLALAGLGAGVVALAVLAALTLGRRLSRPLERLAAAARRVGEGDFAVRAQPTKIKEIDDVGTALNSSSQRVDELVSRERTFSADASHQLRTPLAALRLELETAGLGSRERQAELGAALAQVDRLQNTIETLLAVPRHPERRADDRPEDCGQGARGAMAWSPGGSWTCASRPRRHRSRHRGDLPDRAPRDHRRADGERARTRNRDGERGRAPSRRGLRPRGQRPRTGLRVRQ
jgi:HAMP domain-containing protein